MRNCGLKIVIRIVRARSRCLFSAVFEMCEIWISAIFFKPHFANPFNVLCNWRFELSEFTKDLYSAVLKYFLDTFPHFSRTYYNTNLTNIWVAGTYFCYTCTSWCCTTRLKISTILVWISTTSQCNCKKNYE